MKRIILVIAIWVIFVGGHSLYTHWRHNRTPDRADAIMLKTAEGRYAIEITPTFSAAPDPFALVQEDTGSAPALVVSLSENELLRLTDTVKGGSPIRIEPVSDLVHGSNEIFISASPPTEASDQRHFIQVRVLRDNQPVAEHIFWSEGGARVAGSFRFNIETKAGEDNHDHE